MRRRFLPLVLATMACTACSSWYVRSAPTSADSATFRHAVRVTRTDHSVLVLEHARVSGDSLVGTVSGAPAAVALRDVDRVEERKVSALRSGGLVLGVSAVALALLTLYALVAVTTSWN